MKRMHALWLGLPLLLILLLFQFNISDAQGSGSRPEILAINFPQIIPPNGSAVQGQMEFNDNDNDSQTLELNVIRAYNFADATFSIVAEEQAPGVINFSLSSNDVQPIALEAVIVDARGNRSRPVTFHFAAADENNEVSPGVYFMRAWGQQGRGPGEFDFEGPQGIRPGPDHNVYVVDNGNHRIQVFTPTGEYLTEFGSQGTREGQLRFPSDLVFAPNGNIYVSDSLNHRIQVFDPEFNFLFMWGEKGFDDGQMNAPRGMAINSKNELIVADELNGRIQVFDLEGRFLRKWGELGMDEPGKFNVIVGIDIDADDNVYVADGFNHRIQVFDAEGRFIRQWGKFGKGDAQFDDPVGVAVAPEGWVGITDSFSDRMHIWTKEGAFLRNWGFQSDEPGTGFKLPLGAATDGLGMLFVGDHFNRRAQAFYIAIDPTEIESANASL